MLELISIHIKKTAGRSFRQILRDVYGKKHVFCTTQQKIRASGTTLENMLPDHATVLHGHFWFSQAADIYRANPVPLIAWVRDPVERVISNYYFRHQKIHSGQRPKKWHLRDESLLEYAEHHRNLMSQFLEGISLDELFFIGITEHFAEDVQDLALLLDWKKQVQPVYRNVNTSYKAQFEAPNQDVRDEIAQLNQQDIALYQKALQLRTQRREYIEQHYRIKENHDLAGILSTLRKYLFPNRAA